MKQDASNFSLEKRLRRLEQAIADNERRQRRLVRSVGKNRAGSVPVAASRPAVSPQSAPPASGREYRVRFTEDNAPIFMSGSLKKPGIHSATPVERRNRRLVLLVFLVAVLVGVLYMVLAS